MAQAIKIYRGFIHAASAPEPPSRAWTWSPAACPASFAANRRAPAMRHFPLYAIHAPERCFCPHSAAEHAIVSKR